MKRTESGLKKGEFRGSESSTFGIFLFLIFGKPDCGRPARLAQSASKQLSWRRQVTPPDQRN